MRSWKTSVFLLLMCCIFLSGAKPDDRLAAELGQNLIVGIPGKVLDKGTIRILRYIKPAGVILFRWNYGSAAQFKSLIAQLQKVSNEDTGYPYFIMIDEEPAGAMRIGLFRNILISDPTYRDPTEKNIKISDIPDWDAIEKNIKILSDTGVNVDLAPLADFPFTGEAFIKKRVPAKNVDDLKEFNSRFIVLLKKHGISATLKHFPGIGTYVADPHKKVVYSDMDNETLEESMGIFKDGIDSGAGFVMTSHGIYRKIDPEHSATFSPYIVNELLKSKLDFRGIIITDDLSGMPLGKGREDRLAEAGLEALQAGHHMVLLAHGLERAEKVFNKMLVRIERDPALQKLIRNNHQKVIDIKKKKHLFSLKKSL